MLILFLHGWQSTPGGIKPTYLKEHGHEVLNPALPDDGFDAAVRVAQAEFDRRRPDVVVGSSRGGAVAMNMDTGDVPLVLLCPAWKRWGAATTVKPAVTILHSAKDETVPIEDSGELLRRSGLPEQRLVVVGAEHRMADEQALVALLKSVEGRAAWRRQAGQRSRRIAPAQENRREVVRSGLRRRHPGSRLRLPFLRGLGDFLQSRGRPER